MNASVTPRERHKQLRARLEAVKKDLPKVWVPVFTMRFPEYKGHERHLNNVSGGKSLDAQVITLMEQLAEHLKPSNTAA